jgi:hypothetical protein
MPIIPTTQKVEIEGLKFEVSPGKKLPRPPSQPTSQEGCYYTVNPATWEAIG